MKIYRPIKSNYKSQDFGENKACIELRTGRVVAKTGNVCPAGSKDLYLTLGMKGHNGEDWVLWRGEPIYFPVEVPTGITFRAKTEVDNNGGIGVDVISNQKVKFGKFEDYIKFKFWHMQKVAVFDGQEIEFGKLLGFGNSTGLSSGDHLHWAMKRSDENGEPLERNNGYYGAMDFSLWFENTFVLDAMRVKNQAVEVVYETKLTLLQILKKMLFELRMKLR